MCVMLQLYVEFKVYLPLTFCLCAAYILDSEDNNLGREMFNSQLTAA